MLSFRLGYAYGQLEDRPGQRVMDPPKKPKLFERDFIVLSEFSEQVGPIPVLEVPNEGSGSFNTSTFSVRIMSSDMQRTIHSGNFNFGEDTQVVLSEKVDGAYVYVHYFSLHDIHARGYVRQFAFSYVTSSMKKITDNFTALLERFSEVTRLLKCGNHRVFGKDIEHQLADLEHTMELLQKEGWHEEVDSEARYDGFDFGSENVPERDPTVVQNGITEMKGILRSLEEERNKEQNRRAQAYLRSRRKSYSVLQSQYTSSTSQSGRADVAAFLTQTFHEQQSFESPHSDLSCSSETSYQPQRVMAHIIHKFDRNLRCLEELTSKAYLVAMEKINAIQKHFSRSENVLSMEREEIALLDPRSSVLTVGRVPVMNVLHNAMTNRTHLHEMKPYTLCTVGAVPQGRSYLPLTTPEDYSPRSGSSFNTAFVEDPNAFSKQPLCLDPLPLRHIRATESFSFSEGPLSPTRDERETGGGERVEGREEQPVGEERERDGLAVLPRQPEVVGSAQHLHVLSSGEFHEVCSGGSIGVDTSPLFQTPEAGNSPRISVASVAEGEEGRSEGREKEGGEEGERTVGNAQRHINFQVSNSPLVERKAGKSSVREEGEGEEEGEEDNIPTSSTPVQKNGLVGYPISSVGGEEKSFEDAKHQTENPNREHSNEGVAPANLFRVAQPTSERSSYWPLQRTPPTSIVREMMDSASFGGAGLGEREEEASAGCGTLEESFASGASGGGVRGGRVNQLQDQLGLLQGVRVGQDGVKVHPMVPPSSLEASLAKAFRAPLETVPSMASIASHDLFSPVSYSSPERKPGWSQRVLLSGRGPLPFISSVDQTEGDYKYKPGRGILNFCKDHMATRDLLYCLLHGRTLVLVGDSGHKNAIRRLIRVLWLFVPGHTSSHQVIPWQETPLTPEDISRVKLVGLCREKSSRHPLPPHIERYVSYWDFNTNKVCTPAYQGELLTPILSRTKDRKNEHTFLTHIHSVISDIAMQAFTYYHGHYISQNRSLRYSSSEAAPVRHHMIREEPQKSRKQFLQQLGLRKSDADIIEHFVGVIQQQQLAEYRAESQHCLTQEPATLKLSMKLCQVSICKPKKPY